MRGNVDRFDATIAGWAFDSSQPDQAVEITVSHGERELYRCKADLFRSDLVPVLGSGNHGFSFDPANIEGIADGMVLVVQALGSSSFVMKEEAWVSQNIVAEGVGGWLFLQNDSNDVMRRMAGLVANAVTKINETAMSFVTREAMMAKFGIPYRAVIIPEKNVACAQFCSLIEVSDSRPVPRILEQARSFGCDILYPLEGLLGDPGNFYLKTDTHMNANGYEYILAVLKSEMPDYFGLEVVTPREENEAFCGDLGSKLLPKRTEATEQFKFPADTHQRFVINEVAHALSSGSTLRGSAILVANDLAPRRKLLMFGTSTAYHFLPVVAQFFSEVLFIWENTFDYALIQRFAPDCVLWLAAERFLPTGCNDMLGLPDTLAFLSEKL